MGDTSAQLEHFTRTATDYPLKLTDFQRQGLRQKPFDWNQGHPSFFANMTQLLAALQAMNLRRKSTIVEVGSGSGWTSEILAALKYKLVCVEPAEEMIAVARERVAAYLRMHGMAELTGNVEFRCGSFESISLDAKSADAVLFFESFHHVADEHLVVSRAFEILRSGGVLCLLGETNWIPGNTEAEEFWRAETEEFGTLESPFSAPYLVALLEHHGFVDVVRHHAVNALVPVAEGAKSVESFVHHLHANYVNLVLARKP